jgi:hypothetical protein
MIMSDRDEFIGAHTTPEARKALEQLRDRTKKSVSKLIHEAVVAKLRSEGFEIKDEEQAA